jgi:hypothetical protein
MDSTSNVAYMGLQDYMLPCMNKKLFGFDCPGCGLQRSVMLILKGDFLEAFLMYPAIYPIILLLVFIVLNQFIKLKYALNIKIIISIIIGITIITNYILKINHIIN